MNQQKNSPSVFDPKTMIAVAAVALTYFGWQTYLGKKYPDYNKAKTQQAQQAADQTATTPAGTPETASKPLDAKSEMVATPPTAEQKFTFTNDKVSFVISNHGMGLKDFTVNNYEDKKGNKIKLGGVDNEGLFAMRLVGAVKPIQFNMVEKAPGIYVGTATVGEMTITRELTYDSTNSSFKNNIVITKPSEDIKKGFSLLIPESIHEHGSKSFLFPSYEHQDFFVSHNGGKTDTVNFSNAKDNVDKGFDNATMVSSSSPYFAAAMLYKSELHP